MVLTTTTDVDEITVHLDAMLAADAVAGTVLGTIRSAMHEPDAAPWCAVRDACLAVRSHAAYPVVLAGPWCGADLSELATQLETLADLAALAGSVEVVDELAARLFTSPTQRFSNRLYRLDDLQAPVGVPGAARRASVADRALLLEWYEAFDAEAGAHIHDHERAVAHVLDHGGGWLWCLGGEPVSLAARRATVAGSSRIGPVYTPPDHRARGYGSAVTAAATQDVLDDGAIPVLFTDLSNPTSNKIYIELGYRPVEDRVVVSALEAD